MSVIQLQVGRAGTQVKVRNIEDVLAEAEKKNQYIITYQTDKGMFELINRKTEKGEWFDSWMAAVEEAIKSVPNDGEQNLVFHQSAIVEIQKRAK